jgi:hypothetical protein
MKEIATDGQIIFSRAAAAVYMGPYGKAALTKVSLSNKLQNLKIRSIRPKLNKIMPD